MSIYTMSTTLAQQILSLSLDDNNEKRGDTAPLPSDVSPPPPGHARTISTSSVTSFRNSDESASTPNRPPRSPLRSPRRRTGDSTYVPSSVIALAAQACEGRRDMTS